MTVIATDGNAIEPIVVERIVLMHGERFDFVLKGATDRNLSKFETILKFQLMHSIISVRMIQRKSFISSR